MLPPIPPSLVQAGRARLSRRARRVVVRAGIGATAFATAVLVLAYVLMGATPTWWRTVRPDDPVTLRAATDIENLVVTNLYQNRPLSPADEGKVRRSEPWTVEIHASQANAWLNARLPRWLSSSKEAFRWPREMSQLQVDFDRGQISIGALVTASGRRQVLTATLTPRVDAEGRFFLPARTINLGRLAIPAEWILDHASGPAARHIPPSVRDLPETQALFRAFRGGEALVQRALIRLEDGRRVRVLEVSSVEGVLRLKCQTEYWDEPRPTPSTIPQRAAVGE